MDQTSVMIVEDEALVGIDIRANLNQLGYSVIDIKSTGEAALDMAEKITPEIVIMDIHLKGELSGIDTARVLWNKYRIPVIYLSAYSDDKTLAAALETNPFGYLTKPFIPRELHTTIQTALKRASYESAHLAKPVDTELAFEKLKYIQKNILQRKEIEAKFREQTEIFEKIKFLSDDYTYSQTINDFDRSLVKIEEYADSIGYTRAEIERMRNLVIPLLVHPEDLDTMTNFLDQVIQSKGEAIECEFRLKHKNGNWKWFLNRSMIDFDHNGNRQIITIVRDISSQKNLEHSLHLSKNKFQALSNHPYQGVVVLDMNCKILEMNSTLERMSGYKKEELNNLNHSDYISAKALKNICEQMTKLKNGEFETFQLEARIFSKSSGSLWVYMVFSAVKDLDSKNKFILCNLIDISETKIFERNEISSYFKKG